MSPILQALLDTAKAPHTRELQILNQKIQTQQRIISEKLSYEFLNHYTDLCNQRSGLENDAYFEQGFFTCAQLFVEMLSRYSS